MNHETVRETWTKRVERWRQSGLSAAFAREHGLNQKSLRWWRIRLDNEAQERRRRRQPRRHRCDLAPGPARRPTDHRSRSSRSARNRPRAPIRIVVVGRRGSRRARVRRDDARSRARRAEGARAIPTSVRIFVCAERRDMRRSFDALALVIREGLSLDQAARSSCSRASAATASGPLVRSQRLLHRLYKRLHRASFELPDIGAHRTPRSTPRARDAASRRRKVIMSDWPCRAIAHRSSRRAWRASTDREETRAARAALHDRRAVSATSIALYLRRWRGASFELGIMSSKSERLPSSDDQLSLAVLSVVLSERQQADLDAALRGGEGGRAGGPSANLHAEVADRAQAASGLPALASDQDPPPEVEKKGSMPSSRSVRTSARPSSVGRHRSSSRVSFAQSSFRDQVAVR